jgi:hypothetical protein
MDFGDGISTLIDLACKKRNNDVVEVEGRVLERLSEILF